MPIGGRIERAGIDGSDFFQSASFFMKLESVRYSFSHAETGRAAEALILLGRGGKWQLPMITKQNANQNSSYRERLSSCRWPLGRISPRRHSRHPRPLACDLGGLGLRCGRRWLWPRTSQPDCLAHFRFELDHGVFVVFEELAGVFAALANAFAFVAVPGPGFLQNILVRRQVEQIAFARNALAVHNVEFGLAKGRRDFILDDFDFGARADHHVTFFDGGDAPDINSD